MCRLYTIWQCLSALLLSLASWYSHRTAAERYRAQANVVAAWVVREVRRTLSVPVTPDLGWELDQFQLFLAAGIFRELVCNEGYYPITNSPLRSPTALFEQAIHDARIHPMEPVVRSLPYVRIRIVPGWVKVYGIGTPQAAPLVLYPARFTRRVGLAV